MNEFMLTLTGVVIGWILSVLSTYLSWHRSNKQQKSGCIQVLILAIDYDRIKIYEPYYLPNINNPYWSNHAVTIFTIYPEIAKVYATWANYCSNNRNNISIDKLCEELHSTKKILSQYK